jgi:hypothetical protein
MPSLRDFARMMLDGQIRYCEKISVRPDKAHCLIRRDRCPRCSMTVHVLDAAAPPLMSVCGMSLSEEKRFTTIQNMHADWKRKLESVYAEDLSLNTLETDNAPRFVLRSPPGKPFVTAAGRSGFCPSCLEVVPFTDASSRLPIVLEMSTPILAPHWPRMSLPHWCVGSNGSYCSAN